MIKNLTTIKLLADDVRENGERLADWTSLEDLVHFEALTTHLRNELLRAIREYGSPHGRWR